VFSNRPQHSLEDDGKIAASFPVDRVHRRASCAGSYASFPAAIPCALGRKISVTDRYRRSGSNSSSDTGATSRHQTCRRQGRNPRDAFPGGVSGNVLLVTAGRRGRPSCGATDAAVARPCASGCGARPRCFLRRYAVRCSAHRCRWGRLCVRQNAPRRDRAAGVVRTRLAQLRRADRS
jgi:hypothetical protein